MKLDIIVGLQRGDESKGKITYNLLKQRKDQYTHCMRWGGGANAGHTIYHNNKKLITHMVPTGALLGIKSIIGPGCVLDYPLLQSELAELAEDCPGIHRLVKIAKNVHLTFPEHKEEDASGSGIGSTCRGIGPTYRDKYARKGKRPDCYQLMDEHVIDIYEEFYENNPNAYILMEGAQGFYLDIDHGDYPFVTSSHTLAGGALINGFPPQSVNEIWGAAKVYETYVGSKEFQPPGEIFEQIAKEGQEYGATTGRLRQVDFLHIDELIKAIRMNGVTHLVLSKLDILRRVNSWKMKRTYPDGDLYEVEHVGEGTFTTGILYYLEEFCPTVREVSFSDSPYEIGRRQVTIRR